MVLVVADNRDVERALQRLLTLSKKAGAQFRDDLVVKCVDRTLSIEAPPESAGQVLMRLPWDCLVPLQPFRLAAVDDTIAVSGHDKDLTRACVARMEAFLELYNLTCKLAAHRRTSPWPLVASHPRLLEHVTRGRGRQDLITSGKLNLPHSANELLLNSFLNSRAFDYKATGGSTPAQHSYFRVLLPILDAMNHHFNGAPYTYEQREDGRRHLTVARSALLPGMGNQCFGLYGTHDSLDSWMTYGFIDESVPYVSSIGMTIVLPTLGTIRVASMIKHRSQEELAQPDKDLYFYVPQVLAKNGNDIETAGLLIPGPGAPRSLRRTLNLLITEMRPGHPMKWDLMLHAEDQIIAANTVYYRDLAALLRSISPTDPLHGPIRDRFLQLCNLQLRRILTYSSYRKGLN